MDPSTVGLALSYALTLQTNLNRFVTMFSETETSLVSVERIMEYQNAPQEAPFSIPEQGHCRLHAGTDWVRLTYIRLIRGVSRLVSCPRLHTANAGWRYIPNTCQPNPGPDNRLNRLIL